MTTVCNKCGSVAVSSVLGLCTDCYALGIDPAAIDYTTFSYLDKFSYCNICDKNVKKKCDLTKATHTYSGVPVIACENMPEDTLACLKEKAFSEFNTQKHVVDNVNHPPHYKSHPSGIECIEVTRHLSFNIGNAIKYLWRCDHKNGIEDLKKAVWYIQDEIKKREKDDKAPSAKPESASKT